MTTQRLAVPVSIAVVAVAVVSLVIRLPTTLRQSNDARKRDDAYTAAGRMLAAADSLDIDNDFVTAAVDTLPPDATYNVSLPPHELVSNGQLSEVTYDALRPFMRNLLLPHRPAPASQADYILCYRCSIGSAHVRWVWIGDDGLRIGRRIGA